jgi:hypothetical protein
MKMIETKLEIFIDDNNNFALRRKLIKLMLEWEYIARDICSTFFIRR